VGATASTRAPAPAKAPASWAGNGQLMVVAIKMVAGTTFPLCHFSWRHFLGVIFPKDSHTAVNHR
jgi:hypothetical protein